MNVVNMSLRKDKVGGSSYWKSMTPHKWIATKNPDDLSSYFEYNTKEEAISKAVKDLRIRTGDKYWVGYVSNKPVVSYPKPGSILKILAYADNNDDTWFKSVTNEQLMNLSERFDNMVDKWIEDNKIHVDEYEISEMLEYRAQ